MNSYELNELAIRFRGDLGINYDSPIDFFSVIPNKLKNLTISFLNMDTRISGACCKLKNQQIIFINSNHPKGRQAFTSAHEIYHLLYDDSNFTICNINSSDKMEREANEFASYLLMPINALYQYKKENKIEKWDLNAIIDCEQYFQISHGGLLYRLKKSGEISSYEYDLFLPNIIQNAKLRGYDSNLYQPYIPKDNYTIGNYIRLVESVFEKELISNARKEEYLLDAYLSDLVFNMEEL